MATRVQIPEPGLYVQTIANEQNPGGNVVFLNPGWNELDGDARRRATVQVERTRRRDVKQSAVEEIGTRR